MSIVRDLYLRIPNRARRHIDFVRRLRYWPAVSPPATYNEKIWVRKSSWRNPLFVQCSDKVAVKDYVADILGEQAVTDNLFVGSHINVELIRKLVRGHDRIVLKTNHGSGSVYFADGASSDEHLAEVVHRLRYDLTLDYGVVFGETWYSKITPRVLVEPNISPLDADMPDYKFHVFSGNRTILQVDFDRYGDRHRSFFDENLQHIPISLQYPSRNSSLTAPMSFREMLECARRLATCSSYVRVDLYSAGEGMRFGEMTFAHGGGLERFTPASGDALFGSYWTGDPAY